MKRLLQVFLSIVLTLMCLSAEAQERTVSGRVTSSDDGSPIPGVNVVLKSTTVGTTTDSDGRFSLSVPESGGSLIFSFIGLQTQEIPIGDRTVIDVALSLDATQLSEVVVVGYGTQDRRKVTSSISSISGNSFENLATSSFDQQLPGRAAGLQITVPSGMLGQAPIIRVRGVNSISSGTDPLIVIDNVPMLSGNQSQVTNTNPLGDINPSDIESVEILKDGAATAIYGSRAANGVILITTKRGGKEKGRVNINFSSTTGFSETVKRFDLLNAEQFITIANEKLVNNGNAAAAFAGPNNVDTDWQDVIFRTAAFSNYNLSVGGLTEKTSYFFSSGYTYQEGTTVNNAFDRFSFRSNIDQKISKFLEAGLSLSVARTSTSGLNTGSNALSGNLSGGLRLFPNVPVYDATNPTGYNLSTGNTALGPGNNTRAIDNNYTNIKFVLDNNKIQAASTRILGNGYAKLNIVDGLSIKSQYAVDYLGNRDFLSYDPRHGDGRGSNGVISEVSRELIRWNWQNLVQFQKEFGDHGFDVTFGNEYQLTTNNRFNAGGQNFSDLFFIQNGLITNTYVTQTSSGFYKQTGFDSYFGRINYSYKDKYLLGLAIRNDGISDLAPGNQRGTFPGMSLGYRVSEEDFYRSSGLASIVNNLKLRGSYAEVGNVDIGDFPYAGLYGASSYATQNGIGFTQAGNGDLQWETSKKTDFGVDLGFLSNRITLSFDYFKNDVDNIILFAPTAFSLGIPFNFTFASEGIFKNIGSLTNKGIELSVGAEVMKKGDFMWRVNGNFSTAKNEITGLVKNTAGVDQDINLTYSIVRVGEQLGAFYGYKYAGVNPANGFPMYYKGDGSIVQRNVTSGAYSFYDPNDPSNTSNTTNAALLTSDVKAGGDRRVLGNALPTWYGGLSNTFTYKGFDLEIFIRFSGGNQVYNVTAQENLYNTDFTNGGTGLLNRWTPENPNTDVPILVLNKNAQTNQTGSTITRFLEDGDFMKIQNIVLGYRLPKPLVEKASVIGLTSMRLFVQVQNAFTFTKYSGLDPELNSSTDPRSAGLDFNTNPQLRTYTAGISVGF